jgi:chromate transporter
VSTNILLDLAIRFCILSLFAVGGGVSILIPQMHREFVGQLHWFDEKTFGELIAVAQAAPGPNFLLVPLIGWQVASWPGAFVSLGAFLVIPAILSFTVARLLHDHDTPLLARFRRSFRPVTSGLWIASGTVIALTVDHHPVQVLATLVVFAISLAFDCNPVWLLLGAGALGAVIG